MDERLGNDNVGLATIDECTECRLTEVPHFVVVLENDKELYL